MPQILVTSPLSPLTRGLQAFSSTVGTALELKAKREKIELEKRKQALQEQAFQADVAAAERKAAQADQLFQLRKLQEEQKTQLFQQQQAQGQAQAKFDLRRADDAGNDLLEVTPEDERGGVRDRMRGYRHTLELLPERSREKYIQGIRQEEHKRIIDEGFTRESQELQDAVDDGLFEGNEETAMKMAELIEKSYKSGQEPGDISERLAMLRDKKADADVRVQDWAEAIDTATQFLNTAQTPEAKQKIKKLIVKAQAPSVQKRTEPQEFLLDVQEIQRSEGGFERQEAVNQRVGQTPTMEPGTDARQVHDQSQLAERQARGMGVSPQMPADQAQALQSLVGAAQQGGQDPRQKLQAILGTQKQKPGGAGVDFSKIPKGRKKAFAGALMELLQSEGNGSAEKVLSEVGLDINTLTEEDVRLLVGEDDVDAVLGRK